MNQAFLLNIESQSVASSDLNGHIVEATVTRRVCPLCGGVVGDYLRLRDLGPAWSGCDVPVLTVVPSWESPQGRHGTRYGSVDAGFTLAAGNGQDVLAFVTAGTTEKLVTRRYAPVPLENPCILLWEEEDRATFWFGESPGKLPIDRTTTLDGPCRHCWQRIEEEESSWYVNHDRSWGVGPMRFVRDAHLGGWLEIVEGLEVWGPAGSPSLLMWRENDRWRCKSAANLTSKEVDCSVLPLEESAGAVWYHPADFPENPIGLSGLFCDSADAESELERLQDLLAEAELDGLIGRDELLRSRVEP